MKGLSYNQGRVLMGVLLALVAFSMADHYLHWHVFGSRLDKVALPLMMLVSMFSLQFVPGMPEELKARYAAKRLEEERLESAKSSEQKEDEAKAIRRGIGMPPTEPSEPKREE